MASSNGGNESATGIIECSDGLLVPCWRPLLGVSALEKATRGCVYFVALAYLFIGVSIISDRFMAAVEVITSQEKEVGVKKANGDKHIVVVRVWNETVANLTLLALGSSAPEILLSVIEIWAKNFEAGDLGPGTIVGSAAFNLFVIISICVSVIPNGEVRKIKHLRVFFVTATWSVFAYVWLYIILAVISPGVVEIWESLLTFAFFPITVMTAYVADRRLYKFIRKSYRVNARGIIVESGAFAETADLDLRQKFMDTLKRLRADHPTADVQTLERMAHENLLLSKHHRSRAFYRIQATRTLRGSADIFKRTSRQAMDDIQVEYLQEAASRRGGNGCTGGADSIRFEPSTYMVLENCGSCVVTLERSTDNIDDEVEVEYCTEDGTAIAGNDYVRAKGSVRFAAGDSRKTISIEIIDDEVFEADEHFYVRLKNSASVATVFILDDDQAGCFKFQRRDYELVESVGSYELSVKRTSGARGQVIVPYCTVDGTAKAGKEYEHVEGELLFENNETE